MTEYRENEFITQLRNMADVTFLQRTKMILYGLRQWPKDPLWQQVKNDYNYVARERDLPEIDQ